VPDLLLPANCSYRRLVGAMAETGLFDARLEPLSIRLPAECFIDTASLAFLCSWGMSERARGRQLAITGSDDAIRYLARMNLFQHLNVPFGENFQRHTEVGRFIPLRLIEGEESLKAAVDAICDLVLHQFDNGRDFVPALEWCADEIIGNILDHSESPVPGAVCAQFFPKNSRLDVGICDTGVGIKATVSQAVPVWSHGDAIRKALERGFTRDREVGQGNGLAGSVEIMKLNHGAFELWSGDAIYRLEEGQERGFEVFPAEIPGTGVCLRFDTRRPVDRSLTFMGQSHWTYLDTESRRLAETGGLMVLEECLHQGGRGPARSLRRKVENLLPSMEGPLILDFLNVRHPSSSFLDELLGRLAASLGRDEFRGRVKIINAEPDVVAMANFVIHERLVLPPPEQAK
jgi:hypothetical protein